MPVSMQNKAKPRTKAEVRILESAIVLFSRHGFAGAAVRDVAKHAHVTTMTMYRGFKNRDDLVDETLLLVIKRHFDPSQILLILYEDSIRQDFDALLLSALLRWNISITVPAAKLLINAQLSDNEKLRAMSAEAIENLTKVLATFLDRELQRRPRNKIVARTVARTLLTVLLHMKSTGQETKSAKEEKEETTQVEEVLRYCLIGLQER